MADDFEERLWELCDFLGEVPTDGLVRKARQMFPELSDAAQRAIFREFLRGVAMCRRSRTQIDRPIAEEIAEGVNGLREASYLLSVNGQVVGSLGPTHDLPLKTADDVLSGAAVDRAAADAAEALADAFEEDRH